MEINMADANTNNHTSYLDDYLAEKEKETQELFEKASKKVRSSANLQSRESLLAGAKVIEARKADAAEPVHKITPNDAWKTQFDLWANADFEERCSIIYGMVFHDGAKGAKDITRFFNIKADELKPFQHIINAATVALKLKIQRNVISLGLTREDNPMLKFHLGKQYAEQTENPVHSDVEDLNDQSRNNVVIRVIDKDGKTQDVSSAQKVETYTSTSSSKLQ